MNYLFSMRVALLLLFVFGVAIGMATFIENDYGTQSARAVVYNSFWFEVLLGYFTLTILFNIFKFKTYKNKFPIFLFHFSFLLIMVGALVTRYMGYEGVMHIREGESSSKMVSDVTTLNLKIKDVNYEKRLYFSSFTNNSFSKSFNIDDKKVNIELLKYLPTYEEEIVASKNGKDILELKISTGKRGEDFYLPKGEELNFENFIISFNGIKKASKPIFFIEENNNSLVMRTPFKLTTLNMDTKEFGEVNTGKSNLKNRMLYRFNNNAFVLKKLHKNSLLALKSDSLKSKSGVKEYMLWRVSVNGSSKTVETTPLKGKEGKINIINLEGVNIKMQVGTKNITLPFSIELKDFELKRYPGSMTPSSYSSDVILHDKEINMPFKIYMNHTLNHKNYRFFQSSYDMDEKGTILSVNHDPGVLATYLGYILLAIGMLWTLFYRKGRIQKLIRENKKLHNLFLLLALIGTTNLYSQNNYSLEHTKEFGKIVVQDFQGRMKPMDTMATEIISKITGKTTFEKLTPNQIILGMLIEPESFQIKKMIKIGHPQIALDLGLDKNSKYASFADFFTTDFKYKIFEAVTTSSRKKPLEKTKYDKELLKIDERVNIAFMTYQGSFLRIFPEPNSSNNKWVSPMDAIKNFPKEYAQVVKMSMGLYFQAIAYGIQKNDWSKANITLKGIVAYQNKYGQEVMPSKEKIELEIMYNKLKLFSRLAPYYLLISILLILFSFVNLLKPFKAMKYILKASLTLLIFGFLVHLIGLILRWYISNHAPWSNAYESLVFIALATLFAGLILARKNSFAIAGATLLAGVTMGVAHLNFINPEITNLVPVLKSYWLMIHVATIISGDGFLGLGSILSFIVLLLYIFKRTKNVENSIKELTNLSEIALIVGLFLLTIGNFLGGVWANESWGRYWGWDAKETWALVTILIYATVLHIRFVNKSTFIYNLSVTWAYSTVLMTYFGVNYYLSGLHSYAAGDPVPIPSWVYYAIFSLLAISLLALYRALSTQKENFK